MRYKIVGYVVWQGGKWYLRRRFPDAPRKLAFAAVGGALLAGGVGFAIQRQRSSE